MSTLHLLSYLGLGLCLLTVVMRCWRIARLPLHVRWELYPVAHEKGRSRYGGSYLEEPDWWTRPRRKSLVGELKVMLPEILLLSGVRERNRPHWLRSFPFHLGLYLLVITTLLLVISGIALNAGAEVATSGSGLGKVLAWSVAILGYGAFALVLLGATSLLVRRIADAEYREYTTGVDYLNLLFLIGTCTVALIAHVSTDPDFSRMRIYFAELGGFHSWSTASPLPIMTAAEIVLLSALVAYVPATHMAHFFTKFFMYHDIRWSDEPLRPGTKLETRVQDVLGLRPTWSAAHIGADGSKSWADIATSPVTTQDATQKKSP